MEEVLSRPICDLAEYLGIPYEDARERAINHLGYTEDFWKANPRNTEVDILDFYKTSIEFLWSLCWVWGIAKPTDEIQYILNFCKKERVGSVLDFGGGIGEHCLILSQIVKNITYMDIGVMLAFARWRFRKWDIEVNISKLHCDVDKKYHAVLCCDVLEHVLDPATTWNSVLQSVDPGGVIFLRIGNKSETIIHLWDIQEVKNKIDLSRCILIGREGEVEIYRKVY